MLVRDLAGSVSSQPRNITAVGDTIFFTAYRSNSYAQGLFKTDGTKEGTVLVRDLTSQTGGGFYAFPQELVAVGETLFFSGIRSNGNQGIFKSDGTKAGTVFVRDLSVFTDNSQPEYLTAVGDSLFFTAYRLNGSNEVFTSDGTHAGTGLVTTIGGSSAPASISELTAVADSLFFTAYKNSNVDVYRTEATGPGSITSRISHADEDRSSSPQQLTAVGDKTVFHFSYNCFV